MLKLSAALLVLLFCAGLVWLLLKPGNGKQKNARRIRNALARLLKRPYGAYLIIEEPSFGKYVQFTGSFDEPLIFDLQRQNLTLDEFDHARQLFQELGYPGPQTFEIADSGTRTVTTQTSFIVPFGDDIERATSLSLEVFEKVYGIDREKLLKLTEN